MRKCAAQQGQAAASTCAVARLMSKLLLSSACFLLPGAALPPLPDLPCVHAVASSFIPSVINALWGRQWCCGAYAECCM